MSPKRSYLPLLLLSSTALLLYYYYDSSLHLFAPNSFNPSGTPKTHNLVPTFTRSLNSNPIPSNFTLTIKLLAFDRFDSISRCLQSLSNADYGDDRVNLHIFVDHFKELDLTNESAILDEKLKESHRILDFVDGFLWRFGEKFVHYRTGNVGLQAQWLEAWWPSSDDEFAFVVEDDVEVSPLYYKFLKGLISNYYYTPSNFHPSVYGASLQRPRFVAGKRGNKLQLDSETRLFLYQMVGTWGQLLFPKPWKEFRLWYDIHKAKSIKPILQGMVTTGWYKKMGERIWTPWFIKFIHSRGYFNIYTNFLRERALSVSHRDAGVNYGKTAGPDSKLLDESSLDFNLWKMQPLSHLKWYDFCFREVLPDRAVRSFDELGSLLNSVQKRRTVILVSLYRTSQTITMNLLCHFERLNIQNYILIGVNSEFLTDLERRGHHVIYAEQMINDIRRYKLMGFQGSNEELIKEILVMAYVIRKCLEYEYNAWVIDGNLLPVSETFPDMTDISHDFMAAKDIELLFIKSSPTSTKIWVDDFIYKLASTTDSLMHRGTLASDHRHFGYFAAKCLEKKGQRIKRLDEMIYGIKIDTNRVNRTSLEGGKKMIFWSSFMGLDLIQRRLEDVDMWAIDGDSSCTAVVCHRT
ncbi:transferring glycosyl group transferase [Tasmannia lanceolata]|uniref:transferring glycosyl group transferase n=1 Tax=Tasmannia lanceolata TaxID=3420 RepID=UPI0040640C72